MTTAEPIRALPISSPVSRPMRGSRIDVFYGTGPHAAPTDTTEGEQPLPALSSLDSAFQLQEYISLVIRRDVHNVDKIVSIPSVSGKEDGKGVDENCWIYEQLRRLAQDLTHPLITALQTECTRQTCPEMKAGEWLYLCVAHGNESTSHSSSTSSDGAIAGGVMIMEPCCAIDYILHTIDSATALLNSPRAFPSRLSIPTPSVRHFSSLARRLGRVFAHAYFHHRELFEQAEAESSLYRRFEEMVGRWALVPKEFLVIPSMGRENDLSRDDDPGRREDGANQPRLEAAAVDFDVHPKFNEEDGAEFGSQGKPVNIILDNDNAGAGQTTTSISFHGSNSGSPAGSARKYGRNRTDTMVFSEASALVDELSKSPGGRAQVELATAFAPLQTTSSTSTGSGSIPIDPVDPVESSDTSLDTLAPAALSESHTPVESSSSEDPSSEFISRSQSSSMESSEPEEVPPPLEPVVPMPEETEVAQSVEELQREEAEPEVTPSSSTAPSDSVAVDVRPEVAGKDVDDVFEQAEQDVELSPSVEEKYTKVADTADPFLQNDAKVDAEEPETMQTSGESEENALDMSVPAETMQTSGESQENALDISVPAIEEPNSLSEPTIMESTDAEGSLQEVSENNKEGEDCTQASSETTGVHEGEHIGDKDMEEDVGN
ncbi:Mob1/phocein [Lentinula detonsa]|uniref:Mob1/phocein n=1 Tax=Lentinula detonsa TaxID=2804962 RepID=A0A9W8NSK8_9AGAR|nr:Mob1/phocein [Lentinula detonsa]